MNKEETAEWIVTRISRFYQDLGWTAPELIAAKFDFLALEIIDIVQAMEEIDNGTSA